MCSKCDTISRLSEFKLRAVGKAPKTWLDDYALQSQKIDDKEAKYDEQEEAMREKAREKGRAQVPKLVRQSMGAEFAKLKYNPYDIKALLHPADLIVFDGMTDNKMKNIVFLSRFTSSKYIQVLQKGVAKTISNKNYDWKVVRVSQDGQVEIE